MQRCLPLIVDCPLLTCVVVRFACSHGNHRSPTLGKICEDWIQRTYCPAWHVALGLLPKIEDAEANLNAGLDWMESSTISQPD